MDFSLKKFYDNFKKCGLYKFKNILKSDVVEINIETKDTKIYRYNNKDKVNIKSKDNMAIIKKFRIKSFKNVNSVIEFENISLSYGGRLILDNINFKINEGQIFNVWTK